MSYREFTPLDLQNKWAWYRQGVGVTGVLNASNWLDSYGLGHDLAQASGAAQPIVLPYAGEKYFYAPGVASNYASTPDSAAVSITGDIDLRARIAMNDWTPSPLQALISKWAGTGNQRAYLLYIASSGHPTLDWSSDGATGVSKVATALPVVTDGNALWIRATLDVDNGAAGNDVKFYTAPDGATWTQLGSTVTTAGVTSVLDSTAVVQVGVYDTVAGYGAGAKIYRAQIMSGIGGTLVADFNPALAADSAASFVAATGETWTINATGAKRAQIVGKASMLFDGVAHFLKTAAATLNQPWSMALFGRQPTWTLNGTICDGNVSNSGQLYQGDTTPRIRLYAGGGGTENAGWTLNTYALVTGTLNGASSALAVNGGTAVGGNPGAANAGGFTLAARGDGGAAWCSLQAEEIVIISGALTTAEIAKLYRYGQRQGMVA